jgi:hypothetical protein
MVGWKKTLYPHSIEQVKLPKKKNLLKNISQQILMETFQNSKMYSVISSFQCFRKFDFIRKVIYFSFNPLMHDISDFFKSICFWKFHQKWASSSHNSFLFRRPQKSENLNTFFATACLKIWSFLFSEISCWICDSLS